VVGFLKRKPNRLERLLAEHEHDEASIRAEIPIPAGSLIATRTGTVAHRKSGLPGEPGARCEAMRQWTDWRIVSDDEGLRPCHRCDLAGEHRAAS
jgi:hypothetical protein